MRCSRAPPQLNLFKECSIIPVGFSDHSLVKFSVTIGSLKPKSAYRDRKSAIELLEKIIKGDTGMQRYRYRVVFRKLIPWCKKSGRDSRGNADLD